MFAGYTSSPYKYSTSFHPIIPSSIPLFLQPLTVICLLFLPFLSWPTWQHKSPIQQPKGPHHKLIELVILSPLFHPLPFPLPPHPLPSSTAKCFFSMPYELHPSHSSITQPAASVHPPSPVYPTLHQQILSGNVVICRFSPAPSAIHQ